MSCQYLVNGKLISEDEFKQVLNNGLLDNLIDSKIVSLKGFPLDENKLLSNKTEDKKILSKKSVDAKVLRKILLKEISTREGYPLNMKSALELNETKTDFKIPLWSSPYADKFESLLTSLVSNKVVRQKFSGHSYILGSQEGFKLKEGADVEKELSKSGIVFTKNFDSVKGLQPMRPDPVTGKMLPAQIMVPFMFRDEDGNILKLEQFAKKDENGRWIVDTDRVPEKILNLFGFRIPTQEQNSMASVEIVGFLPEESGDLVLAPRDFTKQMGSDFDVDKLYTYMYNTYYKDGKLHTDFSDNLEDISNKLTEAERELNTLYVDLNLTREEIEFIKEFTEDRKNFIEENKELLKGEANNIKLSEFILTLRRDKQKAYNIKDEIKYRIDKLGEEISILNRSYVAANQNKILDIHQQVMLSTNPDVIKSIMSVDSFGEFEGLAADIFKTRKEKGLVSPIITILSDTYQRDKYMNAAAGKAATGTFSLDSTFNATGQGKELVYINLPEEARLTLFSKDTAPSTEEILKANNPIATFGNISSQGDMSNKYTLASQKLIKENGGKITDAIKDKLKLKSTIIRSLQSSAVDAEKAQILDKLNINDQTFDATRALSILGFEEEDIVGLLTQDIIWEYVDRLKDGRSSLKSYNPNLENQIKEELLKKYDPENRLENFTEAEYERFDKLSNVSGKELINIIKTESFTPEKSTDHNLIQYFLLDKFLKLSEVGVDIKKLQSAINTESKGVPKSIIEATTKLRQINNIGTGPIFNAENLLGKYETFSTGKVLSTPTTVNGFASYYGTKVATEIFNKYFPYNKLGFKETVAEIMYHSQGEDTISTSKQTEIAKDVFKNMRSYLFSNNNTGLFTAMASEERARLFIDVKGKNKSLATILNELSNQKWFIENGFLNKLTFNLNSNGNISRINFDAATGENFDEKNIYLGFISLLDKNVPLGKFNNIEYTSRSLAQDLVIAAFLEGGNQGSKQYLKYIPSSYLKSINFGRYLSGIDFNFEDTFGGIVLEEGFDQTKPSRFARQYFQNNPSKVKSITLEDIQNKPKEIPQQFELNKEALKNNLRNVIINGETAVVPTQFLSIFDSKIPGKYALYEYDFVSKTYKRIPTLAGDYGFKQYDPLTNNVVNIIEKEPYNKKNTAEQLPPGYIPPGETSQGPIKNNLPSDQPRQDLRGKELVNDVLNKLETNSKVSRYNKELISLLRTLPNLNDIKIIIDNNAGFVGSYNLKNNVITLNYSKMKELEFTQNKIASTVIHELIHAYSSDIIKKYQQNQIDSLTSEQINIVKKLENLQKEYTNKLIQEGNKDALIAFHNKYWQSKFDQGNITQELLNYHLKKGPQGLGEATSEFPGEYNAESLSKYYGAIKLEEFVTMALTDEGFQKLLNETPTGGPLPFWKELVDLLVNLIESGLGIKINKDSILPSAIEESLNLLKTNINGKPDTNIPTPTQPIIEPTNIMSNDTYQYYGAKYEIIRNNDGRGIDVVGYKGSDSNKQKLLLAYNNNPNIDPQNGKLFRAGVNPQEVPSGTELENIDSKYELFPGVYANSGQRIAIDLLTDFLSSPNKAFLLQGKGGTGKTTIIKKIVEKAKEQGFTVLGVAPTHKAKKVLGNSIKGIQTSTLASALAIKLDESTGKFTPDEFARSRGKVPIKNASIIIIDESSMISDKLLQEIKQMASPNAKIIFMGDRAQLPPVGQESDSKVFDIGNGYELTEKMRQAATSPIINIGTKVAANVETTGQRIANPIESSDRVNQTDPISGSSILWESNETKALDSFVEDLREANGDVNYAKIVTFNNQLHDNPQSVKNLNRKIRERLFGDQANSIQFMPGEILTAYETYGDEAPVFYNSEDLIVKEAIEQKNRVFNVSATSAAKGFRSFDITLDTVELRLLNDGGVLLPPIPVVANSSKELYRETLQKLFKTDPQLAYALQNKFGNLEYGYAVTSHKAQGSTYKNVYVMEDNIMGPSNGGSIKAKNQSLYVAVSRPSNKLIMVSNKNEGPNINTTPSKTFNISDLSQESLDSMRDPDKNRYYDDYENYKDILGYNDELLDPRMLNPEEVEKFKLLCKK